MSHDVVSLQIDCQQDGDDDMGGSHLEAGLNPQEATSQLVHSKDSYQSGCDIDCKHTWGQLSR